MKVGDRVRWSVTNGRFGSSEYRGHVTHVTPKGGVRVKSDHGEEKLFRKDSIGTWVGPKALTDQELAHEQWVKECPQTRDGVSAGFGRMSGSLVVRVEIPSEPTLAVLERVAEDLLCVSRWLARKP